MTFAHMTCETSHGAFSPEVTPGPFVVRCVIRCSASLSNSMVKATRTWDRRVGNGSRAAMTTMMWRGAIGGNNPPPRHLTRLGYESDARPRIGPLRLGRGDLQMTIQMAIVTMAGQENAVDVDGQNGPAVSHLGGLPGVGRTSPCWSRKAAVARIAPAWVLPTRLFVRPAGLLSYVTKRQVGSKDL
jgi:hypothetical protein